ncbi:MAG TPA: type II toxin-antitoxin system HicA family toxin [bacterium]|nr:type II toxin-antitoxin system HicA family toxin [bacterium]HPP30113.1 type II toxin-antitoxin system HicA family toxin [bacterium]
MGCLANISGKEAVRALSKIGYVIRREGSHMILYNDRHGYPILVIPDHKELAPALLRAQIKRAGLSVDDFLKLCKGK